MPQKTYYSKIIDKPGTVYQRARNIRRREPLSQPSSSGGQVLIIRQPIRINPPDLLGDPSKPLPPYGTERAITFEPIDIAGSSPELAPFLQNINLASSIAGPSYRSVPFHESQQPTETAKAPEEQVLPQTNQTKDSSDKCASPCKHKDKKNSKSSSSENSETSSESASSKKSKKHDSTENLKRDKHDSNKNQKHRKSSSKETTHSLHKQEELDQEKSKKEKETNSTQTSGTSQKRPYRERRNKPSKIKSKQYVSHSSESSSEETQQKYEVYFEKHQKPSNRYADEPCTSVKPPKKPQSRRPPAHPRRYVLPQLIPAIAQAAAAVLTPEVKTPGETKPEAKTPSKPQVERIPPGPPQPAPTTPLAPKEVHKRLLDLRNIRGIRCSVCTTQDASTEGSLLPYPSQALGPLEIFETEGRSFNDVPTVITFLIAMLQLSLAQQYNRYNHSFDVNEAWNQLLDLDSGVFDSTVQSPKPETITTLTRAGMLDQYLEEVGYEHIAELEAGIHQEPFDVSSDSYFETLTEEKPEPVTPEQIVPKDISPLQADSEFESVCKDMNIKTETPEQGITETRSHMQVQKNPKKLFDMPSTTKEIYDDFKVETKTCKIPQIGLDLNKEVEECQMSPTEADDLNMETDDEVEREFSDSDMERERRCPGPVLRVALNKAEEERQRSPTESDDSNMETDDEIQREFSDSDMVRERRFPGAVLRVALNKEEEDRQTPPAESDDSNMETDDERQREFSDSDVEIERRFQGPVLQVALNKTEEERQTSLTESDDLNMETDDEIQREVSDSDMEIERRFQLPVLRVALNKEQEERQTSLTDSDLNMETEIQREFSDSDMEIETFEIPQQANIESATFQTAYSNMELETLATSQFDAGMDTFQISNNEPQPFTMNSGLNPIFQLSENDQMILNTFEEINHQELNKLDEPELVESYLNEVIGNDNYLMDLDETEFTDLLNIDIPLDSD